MSIFRSWFPKFCGKRNKPQKRLYIPEATPSDFHIMDTVGPFTMTNAPRKWALLNSIQYIVDNNITGDICECGVWRGGSMMAAALKLMQLGERRTLWLYDTFSGMSEPTEKDKRIGGDLAWSKWSKHLVDGNKNEWCLASLEEVISNLESTRYEKQFLRFVKGKVEETLLQPDNLPENIAILRLDTDWYESTKAELEVLYKRMSCGAVIILDDYGCWDGAKRAVDEFFQEVRPRPLFSRIDSDARIGIKIG
jgi:hypothetical protein